MRSSHFRTTRHRRDGQVLTLFVLFALVLVLFVGLGIDLGFAYITKAQLSKALDAGSLAAVSNYSSTDGGTAANTLAINTFWANYGTNGVIGRAANGRVTPTGTFVPDPATGILTYTNFASTKINTYFIRLLPQWRTLTVADTSVATRAPVIMTLVLDRSGSMDPVGNLGTCSGNTRGGLYLPGAVTQFINIFDEQLDRAALVTFSVSSSNDVRMSASKGPFKTPIITAINRINNNNLWAGGTCTISGMTNALVIQDSVINPNAVKVVVLFTDGQANMSEGVFNGVPLNFGGQNPLKAGCPFTPQGASFWRTNTAESSNPPNVCNVPGCNNAAACNGGGIVVGSTFTNAHNTAVNFCTLTITEDATNRCVLLANQMRASKNSSNYVYAVGLAVANAVEAPTLDLLQEVANDPDSSTFDPQKPVGAAFLSSGQDLAEVFRQVAADIILRLVR